MISSLHLNKPRILAFLTLCVGLVAGTVMTLTVPDLQAMSITPNGETTEQPSNPEPPKEESKGMTITANGNDQPNPTSVPSSPQPTSSAPQSPTASPSTQSSTNAPAPCN